MHLQLRGCDITPSIMQHMPVWPHLLSLSVEKPSLASLTALFTTSHLTRLTISAFWLSEEVCLQLLTQHRFPQLRCLQLIAQLTHASVGGHWTITCPQTDAALLPLVKASEFVVLGRQERQAARAARRRGGAAEAKGGKRQPPARSSRTAAQPTSPRSNGWS